MKIVMTPFFVKPTGLLLIQTEYPVPTLSPKLSFYGERYIILKVRNLEIGF